MIGDIFENPIVFAFLMSIHAILFLEKLSPSVLYRGHGIKYE